MCKGSKKEGYVLQNGRRQKWTDRCGSPRRNDSKRCARRAWGRGGRRGRLRAHTPQWRAQLEGETVSGGRRGGAATSARRASTGRGAPHQTERCERGRSAAGRGGGGARMRRAPARATVAEPHTCRTWSFFVCFSKLRHVSTFAVAPVLSNGFPWREPERDRPPKARHRWPNRRRPKRRNNYGHFPIFFFQCVKTYFHYSKFICDLSGLKIAIARCRKPVVAFFRSAWKLYVHGKPKTWKVGGYEFPRRPCRVKVGFWRFSTASKREREFRKRPDGWVRFWKGLRNVFRLENAWESPTPEKFRKNYRKMSIPVADPKNI